MAEGGEGNKFNKIKQKVVLLRWQAREIVRQADLRLDPDANSVIDLLGDMSSTIKDLVDPDNIPKVLEVEAQGKRYVSVRRIEGDQLMANFVSIEKPQDEDTFETKLVVDIPKDYIE